jgi:hypothetical protein
MSSILSIEGLSSRADFVFEHKVGPLHFKEGLAAL